MTRFCLDSVYAKKACQDSRQACQETRRGKLRFFYDEILGRVYEAWERAVHDVMSLGFLPDMKQEEREHKMSNPDTHTCSCNIE